MKFFVSLSLLGCAALQLVSLPAHAEEGSCKKCERIREHNAQLPPNEHYYYEDYLKAQEQAVVAPPETHEQP